jgi:hypothetical protein
MLRNYYSYVDFFKQSKERGVGKKIVVLKPDELQPKQQRRAENWRVHAIQRHFVRKDCKMQYYFQLLVEDRIKLEQSK